VESILQSLGDSGFRPRLVSFSAVDRYLGFRASPIRWVESDAGIADLAKLFDKLRFPGSSLADAALDVDGGAWASGEEGGTTWYFFSADEGERSFPADLLNFSWDPESRSYRDPFDVYERLRALRAGGSCATSGGELEKPVHPSACLGPDQIQWSEGKWGVATGIAVMLARYVAPATERRGGEDIQALVKTLASGLRKHGRESEPPLSAEEQRVLLLLLMESRGTGVGLDFLGQCGFISLHWPELAAMDGVDHSKEFHPEGNAWRHTLETFRYRKYPELALSLGLLLHDSGKPLSEASNGRRFDRHAELGARCARDFLSRLGIPSPVVETVQYLVRNHMMPAALPRLPLTRTQEVLESPLFPLLLELYRCDESSSFKGPEGFYESCAAYRAYLRNVKNPYRSADGKKLMKRFFSSM